MKQRRRAFIAMLLFSVVVINYIDRVALSVAAKPIATEFGLSPVTMGYLFSCFLWTYVPALIPIGVLIDRTGPKRMVGGGVALWSAATAAFGAAGGFGTLLVARLAMGVGEATTFPSMGRVVRDWIPQGERGLVTTLANCGSSAGPAVGAILTGVLVASYGWRVAFLLLGLLGFVWLAIWWFVFDQPERASWLGDDERRLILRERNGPQTAQPVTGQPMAPPSPIWHLLQQRSVIGVMLTQSCIVYTTYLFVSWLPSYLQSTFDLSIASAGSYTAIPYVITAVIGVAIARFSDRRLSPEAVQAGERRVYIAVMLVLSLTILVAPFTTRLWELILVVTLVLTGSTTASSLNFTLASDLITNPRDAGRITSMVAFGGNAFGLISPIVTGYIVAGTGSYRWAFWIAGGLLLMGIALTTLATRQRIPALSVPGPLFPARSDAT